MLLIINIAIQLLLLIIVIIMIIRAAWGCEAVATPEVVTKTYYTKLRTTIYYFATIYMYH